MAKVAKTDMIHSAHLEKVLKSLGATNHSTNPFTGNRGFDLNGQHFTIKDIGADASGDAGAAYYYIDDVFNILRGAGINDTDTINAITSSAPYIFPLFDGMERTENGVSFTKRQDQINALVDTYKSKTEYKTKGDVLYDTLKTKYPYLKDLTVTTRVQADGTDTKYTVSYTEPTSGRTTYLPDITDLSDIENITSPTYDGVGNVLANANKTYEDTHTERVNLESQSIVAEKLATSLKDSFTTAKQDYNLTDAEWNAIKTILPNYSDQQISNALAQSPWIADFVKNLNPTDTKVTSGASLEEIQKLVSAVNQASGVAQDATLKQTQDTLLTQIRNDPQLYKAVTEQLRANAGSNVLTGQAAANIAEQAAKVNAGYNELASEMYGKQVGGENNVVDARRQEILNSEIGGLTTHANQQIGEMHRQATADSDTIEQLINALGLLGAGIRAEDAATQRKINDALSESNTNTQDIIKIKEGLASDSQAAADAALNKQASAVDDLLGLTANDSATQEILNLLRSQITGGAASSGTGTVVKPKLLNPEDNYIDESTYQALVKSGLADRLLSPEAVAKYKKRYGNEQELADAYDVGYLIDAQTMQDKYKDFAEKANAESDRVFNDAQRAYLAAIAAGDAKTTAQLTKLAQNAGTSKRNLYGAAAFSDMFSQQKANANVGNSLTQDYIKQQANNANTVAKAQQKALEDRTTLLGTGDANDRGLNAAFNKFNTNATRGEGAYTDLLEFGIDSQSKFNTATQQGVAGINANLTEAANRVTSLNNKAAASNTINKATHDTLINKLNVRKETADARLDELAKKGL